MVCPEGSKARNASRMCAEKIPFERQMYFTNVTENYVCIVILSALESATLPTEHPTFLGLELKRMYRRILLT